MKTHALMFGLVGASFVQAAKEKITVVQGEFEFKVIRFDDGRRHPYRVNFGFNDNTHASYRFNTDGIVKKIKVDSEKYKVRYKSNGNIKTVELTSDTRSLLTNTLSQEEEHLGEHLRRSLYACEDCAEAWEAVCNVGAPSVCNLLNYGPPFSEQAHDSIEIMCFPFGQAACIPGGQEACAGQCEYEDEQ